MTAHRAAQPTTQWITIGRYGAGANPIIDGNNTDQWGFDLSGSDSHYRGGWKIQDIDFKNQQVAAIRAETNAPSVSNGIWVVSSTPGVAAIDHITGVAFNSSTHTLNTPIPGYTHFTALGIDVVNVPYTFVEGYTVTNTDTPWLMGGTSDTVNYQLTATHSYYLHPYLEFATRGLVKNVTTEDMCNIGIPSGKAGYIFSVNTDAIADTVEIKNATGNAFDMEGQNVNSSFFGVNFHDYGDACFLDMSNGGANTGTMMVNSTFNHCANTGTDTKANLIQTNPLTLTTDHMIVYGNTITKSVNQGFLFSGPTYSTSKTNTLTDLVTQGTFSLSNTVN